MFAFILYYKYSTVVQKTHKIGIETRCISIIGRMYSPVFILPIRSVRWVWLLRGLTRLSNCVLLQGARVVLSCIRRIIRGLNMMKRIACRIFTVSFWRSCRKLYDCRSAECHKHVEKKRASCVMRFIYNYYRVAHAQNICKRIFDNAVFVFLKLVGCLWG